MKAGGFTKRICQLEGELASLRYPTCRFIVYWEENRNPGYYTQLIPDEYELKKDKELWDKRHIIETWYNGKLL